MSDDQRFMAADGSVLSRLRVDEAGRHLVPSDAFSAIRVVLAALDSDDETMFELLRDRPALPLMSGLISLVLAVGERAYGEQLRAHLDLLAAVSDEPAADEYREARRSA